MTTLTDLLRSLEPLTHRDRIQQMVQLGARSRQDATLTTLLQQLAGGNFYERYLALYACYGSQNTAVIIAKLNDSSHQLRTLALWLLALFGDDVQVLSTLESLPIKQCTRLLSHLRKRHRQTVIDQYLDRVAATDTDRLMQILSSGSASFVVDRLHLLLEKSNATDWKRVARRHPSLVAQTLQQAEAATEHNPRLIDSVNAVLPQLAEACADQAVRLCQAVLNTTPIVQLQLQPLVTRAPHQVADLVIQSDDRALCDFDSVAKKLDAARLQALIERGYLHNPQVWLAKLAPQVRTQLYEAYRDRWCSSNGVLPTEIVQTLSRAQRLQEAQVHLNLPLLQTRPAERLPYAAFLPWNEALSTLLPFIQNPDPDLRAIALRIFVETVRFNRDRAAELLQKVVARRNEQDPIRGTILAALADLPPGLWQPEHLSDLAQFIQASLSAADFSQTTGMTAERFVIGVLPFHTHWAAEQLALLVRTRGILSFYELGDRLSDAQVRQIAPDLLPVFRDWEARDRAEFLVAAALCFGRRLKVFDALVNILERMTQSEDWAASSAIQVLAQFCPSRLPTLIPELIRQDASWILNGIVQSYLHRYRQDLLTPFLAGRVYQGRFATRRSSFVLDVQNGFHRWTPAQQQIFSEALTAVTQDSGQESGQESGTVFRAMRQLGALQTITPDRLIELADLNNPSLAVRDTALRVLADRDNGDGISVLLEAMNDDRGRIAIYALRTAILSMSPTQALTLLRNIPLEKVTVAKEVVRLIGEVDTEAAYQELLALNQRELHRDVRVAVLRSLWLYLEQTETWEILQQAATSSDSAIAIMVSRTPDDRLSPDAQAKLLTLLATLMQHSDPFVRLEVLRRCGSQPITDANHQLQQPLLRALHASGPDEPVAAAQALLAIYSGREPQLIAEAIAQILPDRQTLQTFIQALQSQAQWQGRQLLPAVEVALETLASDPLVSWLRLQLAIATLPTQSLIDFLTHTIDTLIPETLGLVVQSIKQRTHRHNLQDLVAIETALSEQSDYRLRRLGLAALEAQVQLSGWTNQQRSRLTDYQADTEPAIATVAQFIFPPQS